MRTPNVANIIPANTRMFGNIASIPIELSNLFGFSIQIVFTGTPTGVFKLQASCDPVANPKETIGVNGAPKFEPTNWSDVEDSEFTVTAAGNVFWNYAQNVNWSYVRVFYTDNSAGSTATITSARFNGKGV